MNTQPPQQQPPQQLGSGRVLEAAWFLLAGPAGMALGWLTGSLVATALLPVLLMYPAYWRSLGRRRPWRTFGLALLWALGLALGFGGWTYMAPQSAGALIWNGPPYVVEMFDWIRTGHGAEGDWRLFLPLHVAHFSAFVFTSLLSAGLLGLAMGSALMGYMSHYVGSVAAASASPVAAALIAWHPWSVLRVIGFVAVGVALSMPLRHRSLNAVPRRLLVLGLGLVVADAILKTAIAGTWRTLLLARIGG